MDAQSSGRVAALFCVERDPAYRYWSDPERAADTAVPGIVRLDQAGPMGDMLYVERPASEHGS